MAGRQIGGLYLVHRLMHVRIELLALGREFRYAIFLQHLHQLTLGELDAFDQRRHLDIGMLAQFGLDCAQRAMHVVGHCQHVAGESGNAIDARVGDLALGAFAQVLHLGQRAQQSVFEFRSRFQSGGDLLGRHQFRCPGSGCVALGLGSRVVSGGPVRHSG